MADLPGALCGATSWCINPATGTPAVCTDRPHVAWQPHVDHRGLVDFAFTPDTVAPPGRPWEHVTPVSFCPACLGTLPPDSYAACSTCGGGIQPPRTITVLDEEHVHTREEAVEIAAVAARLAQRTSWATWPNIAVEVTNLPPPDPSWPARDIAEMVTDAEPGTVLVRQGTFTPTGPPYFPVPPLSEPFLPRHTQAADEPPPAPLPWWRRIWRRG